MADDRNMMQDDGQELLRAQLSAYVSRIWLMVLGNLGIAVLLAIFLWHSVNPRLMTAWVAMIVLVNGLRVLLVPDMAGQQDVSRLKRGMAVAVVLTTMTGALWGSTALWLFPEDLTHQLILMLTLAGFAAGALTLVSSIPLAYPLFVILILAPLAVVLQRSDIEAYRDISILLTVYGLYLMISYRTHRKLFLESVRLRIRLQELVQTDPLTRIPNRRYFDERFPTECRRACRDAVPLTLVLLDIDHFKRLNDTLGHQVGDQVLREVASRLQAAIRRPGDFVARIGGEEFAIVLPGTDTSGAEVMVRKLRDAVRDIELPGTMGERNRLTVSMGVASCDGHDGDPDRMFASADAALYRAKQEGRDTWRVASAEPNAAA